MSKHVSPTSDAAGSNPPPSPALPDYTGAVVCTDAAEARLLRRQKRLCITAAKLRSQIWRIVHSKAEGAEAVAVEAIGRLGGATDAACPADSPFWDMFCKPTAEAIKAALRRLPEVATPFANPSNVEEMAEGFQWDCEGTTILVAKDTVDLVRAAYTYGKFDCYRHRGRMDEPFTPQAGRVCLIVENELHLIRLSGLEDVEIVFTYNPCPEGPAGQVDTRPAFWPVPLRALCGERPDLKVGIATFLVRERSGRPFFLGLTRGPVSSDPFRNDPASSEGACAMCAQTNRKPMQVTRHELTWEGGDDIRYLVRFGGLTVFQGMNKRRKVQLRSLGLIRSGTVAGAPVYDLDANHDTLWAWVTSRQFERPFASQRLRDRRRVRCSPKALPESRRGTIYNTYTPRKIQVTQLRERKVAFELRNFKVGSVEEGGRVSTVRLETLREGGCYLLNSRATVKKDGKIRIDMKRCKIRAPKWVPADVPGMLAWLAQEPHVVFVGLNPKGAVFAVVRVANGTEDQQREAATRWAEEAGIRFPHASGCPSWVPESLNIDAVVTVGALHHTNWRAQALVTACFERYQREGDYAKPIAIASNGTASAPERARAYVEALPESFDCEGSRNANLSTAMLCIRDKIGRDGLLAVLPALLAKSSLPEHEKRKMARDKLKGKG